MIKAKRQVTFCKSEFCFVVILGSQILSITREAVTELQTIHSRSPLLLTPKQKDFWISEAPSEDIYNEILDYTYKDIQFHKVDRAVSNPKNNIANIEIFPNPVNHKLELNGELNGDFLITIYDVSAKRILSIKNSKLIDISNLNKGFYFLNLSSNNQLIKTLKFIKQ